jgi:hypothetical protein
MAQANRRFPSADHAQLADGVADAVNDGRTVVIGRDDRGLEFSDQILPGQTGNPDNSPFVLPGRPLPNPANAPGTRSQ